MRRRLAIVLRSLARHVFWVGAFLTILPFPARVQDKFPHAAVVFFPVVGLGFGVSMVLVSLAVAPLGVWITAWLVLCLSVLLSRGFHLDGLVDVFDAFAGGRDPERRLEILKDPRVGSFGATALVLLLTGKLLMIRTLLETEWGLATLWLVPILSRASVVVLGAVLPAASTEGGLGKAVFGEVTRWDLAATVVLAVVSGATTWLFWQPSWQWVAATSGCAALVAWMLGYSALRLIGGITGDVCGAQIELSEVAMMLGSVWLVNG